MQLAWTSLRVAAVSMLVCVGGYTLLVLGFARAFAPDSADGSLIRRADGTLVGSRLVAQAFDDPRYFWPRPSACGYDAARACGSNLSPTSPRLTERAAAIAARYGASAARPLPAELAAASGGGLDPHVTEHGALYQTARVAEARGIPLADVEALVHAHAFASGGVFMPERIVNVLELNLALDEPSASRSDPR